MVESYITHVRIVEDSAYPSSPAPPTGPPENKKARVIIVAVRRSGRVRMHKARENNDGSFSIGKTWMLDDLSAIQSFNAWVPSTPLEEQQKQWASSVGFVVNVGKPYYWHAKTSKEKDFFIASLVKIYKKYTGGKMPNLIGFDERERQLLLGAPPSGAKGPMPGPSHPEGPLPHPRPPSSQGGSRPQSPHWAARARSRDAAKRRPAEEELPIRAQRSREQMRRPSTGQSGKSGPPPFAPPQHPPPVTPVDQNDQLPPPRAIERLAAESGSQRTSPLSPPGSRNKDVPSSLRTAQSREKVSKESKEGSLSSLHTEPRPPSSRSGKTIPEPRPTPRSQDSNSSIPETRRVNDDIVPGLVPSELRVKEPSKGGITAISTSSGQATAPVGDQLSSSGHMQAADVPPALFPGSSASNSTPAKAVEAPQAVSEKKPEPSETINESQPASPPTSPPEDPKGNEEDAFDAHRPGLGPMIKKKSNKDVAGAFRKAANAYGAFKPRAGGAGEKLLAAAKKQAAREGPDGITGVVPAPSLLRKPDEDSKAITAEERVEETTAVSTQEATVPTVTPPLDIPDAPAAPAAPEPPKVQITEAVADTAVTPMLDVPGGASDALTSKKDARSRSVSPSPRDRRRRRHEDNTVKYCQALGLDPKVLLDRGVDFDDILTDLGWNGRLSDEKRIEDLEADVRREIGRVEATSWLGNLEQQEGKVDQLARLIDKTVDECEELDNLLTLYSHELNVSLCLFFFNSVLLTQI